MNKRRISLLLALLLILSLTCTVAFAQGDEQAQLYYVTDDAGLLSSEDRTELESKAAAISARNECSVYIVTVEEFRDFSSGEAKNAAESIFNEYSLGWGADHSGVLLLLSMARRDYGLFCKGFGNEALTDYGQDLVIEAFLDDFAENDWDSGFEDYLEKTDELLAKARAGATVDGTASTGATILASVATAAVIAAVVCLILYLKMRSVAAKHEADQYAEDGNITQRSDVFTHITTERIKIESNSSSSGSRSSSSGRSGKF